MEAELRCAAVALTPNRSRTKRGKEVLRTLGRVESLLRPRDFVSAAQGEGMVADRAPVLDALLDCDAAGSMP
jgi:hypothetical protein